MKNTGDSEQADVKRRSRGNKELKRKKARGERRRAKLDPEALATYNRYSGWQS